MTSWEYYSEEKFITYVAMRPDSHEDQTASSRRAAGRRFWFSVHYAHSSINTCLKDAAQMYHNLFKKNWFWRVVFLAYNWRPASSPLPGIKIPENCVARVREELLLMDEEVKRRRKEREQAEKQLAMEKRLAEEQKCKMENKHLLANLCSQELRPNQSLIPILKHQLSPNFHQRTERISQLHRMQAQTQGTLPQPSQNIPMLPLQRNPSQTQQRTHSWPNNVTPTSTSNNGPLPNMVSPPSNFAQFYSSYLPLSLHQTMLSPSMSSKNPLNEILDLTESSPSPSPDTTEVGLNLDRLRHTFDDDFNLESMISQNASNVQHAPQMQQSLLLQKQPLQATLQQNHNLLANNHQTLIDFFDPSPQVSTQKASPSSSTSSGSSSMSSLPSVSNSLVSHVPAERLPAPPLTSSSSSSSSVISSTSSPSSLFSSSYFPSPCLPSQSGSQSSHLPNDHSTETLDVREVLNSMLQNGLDRQTVIQYWQQDWALKQQQLAWTDVSLGIWLWADCVLFAAVCDRTVGPTPSPLRAYSHVTACVRSPHPSRYPPVAFTCLKLSRRQRARPVSDFCTKMCPPQWKAAVTQTDGEEKKKKTWLKCMFLNTEAVENQFSFAECVESLSETSSCWFYEVI